jgi:hydrogenase maturation protein HypF
MKLSSVNNISKAVIGGGVFQNNMVLQKTVNGLRRGGIEVFVNELVPCNDGGISLGQAYLLRDRLLSGSEIT